MGLIPKQIEERIVAEYGILQALEDISCVPRKSGKNWICKNPFREDRSAGSFVINTAGNYAKDFATDKCYSPMDILMEGYGITYPDALRKAAKQLGIYVDDTFVPDAAVIKRAEPKKLPLKLWSPSKATARMGHYDENPLVSYLMSLPLIEEDKKRLKMMLEYYRVGTSIKGKTKGWTIWWQIDELANVHTAKLMAYKSDGHRDKYANPYIKNGEQCYYSFDFMHSLVSRSRNEPKGMSWDFDDYAERYETCLFGLHLIDLFPSAEIRIVESEKSALICSIFTNPEKIIWLATTGKSNLSREKLMPIITRKRNVVLYPDYDGYEEWENAVKKIGYEKICISQKVREQWIESDGPKADMADIMLRLLYGLKNDFKFQEVNDIVDRIPSVGDLIKEMGLQIDSARKATEEEIEEYGNIRGNAGTAEGTV